MREHVRKHKEKYKNIILLLIIAFILGWLFSTYYSKKTVYEEIKINQEEVNSYVDDVYRNMNTNLYEAIEEKDFVSFAINSIEKSVHFIFQMDQHIEDVYTIGQMNCGQNLYPNKSTKYTTTVLSSQKNILIRILLRAMRYSRNV